MAVFHRKPDGKHKINPISILRFGSVFSSASADRDLETTQKARKFKFPGFIHTKLAFIGFSGYVRSIQRLVHHGKGNEKIPGGGGEESGSNSISRLY
jgi:hypothetical protein